MGQGRPGSAAKVASAGKRRFHVLVKVLFVIARANQFEHAMRVEQVGGGDKLPHQLVARNGRLNRRGVGHNVVAFENVAVPARSRAKNRNGAERGLFLRQLAEGIPEFLRSAFVVVRLAVDDEFREEQLELGSFAAFFEDEALLDIRDEGFAEARFPDHDEDAHIRVAQDVLRNVIFVERGFVAASGIEQDALALFERGDFRKCRLKLRKGIGQSFAERRRERLLLQEEIDDRLVSPLEEVAMEDFLREKPQVGLRFVAARTISVHAAEFQRVLVDRLAEPLASHFYPASSSWLGLPPSISSRWSWRASISSAPCSVGPTPCFT